MPTDAFSSGSYFATRVGITRAREYRARSLLMRSRVAVISVFAVGTRSIESRRRCSAFNAAISPT